MAAVIGCGDWHKRPGFPPHLMVNLSANTYGELFPCGCRIPLGGLSRRAGVLSEDSPYAQITLDAGGFSGGTTAYDRFVAGWLLKAYALMGYQAVNLGYSETLKSVSQIREWDAASGGMLISANLTDREELPVTRRFLIRETGGIRIGITGITQASEEGKPTELPAIEREGTEMPRILDPVPQLRGITDEFKKQGVDFVVLLADVPDEDAEAIAAEYPEIDLIVQARGFSPHDRFATRMVGENARAIHMGGEGKYLGRLRLDFEPDGTVTGEEPFLVELDSTVPTLSAVSELLVQFKKELRERREEFLGDPGNPFQRIAVPEMADVLVGYAGEFPCQECHPGFGLDQQMVRHPNAWLHLDEQHRNDPSCLPCHVTGFGVPTGFENPLRDSHLKGVTCEACHGPASLHVRRQTVLKENLDPESLLPEEDPTGIPFSGPVPEATCRRCHTEEWSPDFNYEEWLPRVNHHIAVERQRLMREKGAEGGLPEGTQTDELPADE
jgi:hypothetical protein